MIDRIVRTLPKYINWKKNELLFHEVIHKDGSKITFAISTDELKKFMDLDLSISRILFNKAIS